MLPAGRDSGPCRPASCKSPSTARPRQVPRARNAPASSSGPTRVHTRAPSERGVSTAAPAGARPSTRTRAPPRPRHARAAARPRHAAAVESLAGGAVHVISRADAVGPLRGHTEPGCPPHRRGALR
eukprot:scaffold1446_cov391-Prasinococcus_capsulatus_cf.AAC.23